MKTWVGLLALAVLLAAPWARADPLRILVAVSHSRGAPGETPLRHAAADVDHVEAVLADLGGFRRENIVTLVDPTLAMLNAAIDRAGALAASRPPGEVTFLFYFSGHGDRDRIHLGPDAVPMGDLTARIRAVPAALRLIVTDACRSYPMRSKGVTTEPGFAIDGSQGQGADGVVSLYASAEGEPARESDELEGALFTHYWVSALRGAGDANGDGRVTLAESYDFAYSQTLLRSSGGNGVLQHPAAVYDLSEAAPIVLTRTGAASAMVRFPAARDARFLVYERGSRTVLGEVWGSVDRDVVFALSPGRFLVQRSGGGGSAGVEFALAPGETRTLRADEFRPVPAEELAAKGGTVFLRRSEVGMEVAVGASRLSTFGESVALRYALRWDTWALSLGVGGALGTQNTEAEHVRLSSVGGDAEVERRWSFGAFGVAVGAGGEADVVHQTLERTDAARVAAAGYPTTQTFTGLAPGPVAVARLRFSTTLRTWVELAVRGGVLFPDFGTGPGALWTARAGLGAGSDF